MLRGRRHGTTRSEQNDHAAEGMVGADNQGTKQRQEAKMHRKGEAFALSQPSENPTARASHVPNFQVRAIGVAWRHFRSGDRAGIAGMEVAILQKRGYS